MPAIIVAAVLALAPILAVAGEDAEGPGTGRENQPPVLVFNIPLQSFPENNICNKGYHLVNLSKYFSDDGGVENLTFTVVHATDPSHICATVDGNFLSFSTPTKDWYGQERFRVRATDAGGLWAESNDFTVRVTPVTEELHIHELPVLYVYDNEERYFDITPFLHSDYDAPEVVVITTNSSFVRVNGRVLFILVPRHENNDDNLTIQITAIGLMNQAQAELHLVVYTFVWAHPVRYVAFFCKIEIPEDGFHFEYLRELGPLNPDVFWNITEVLPDTPPIFKATLTNEINNETNLRITPGLHRYGAGKLSIVATVPKGLRFVVQFNISIVAGDVDHRLIRINDTIVSEHENVSFRLIKEDPWDDLVFWTNSTFFNITPEGWVNFTPDQKEVGFWHIFYSVSIDGFHTARREFNLTVLNLNEPPENATILKPKDQARFTVGKRIDFECNASDVDGDQLKYEWRSSGVVFGMGKRFSTSNLKVGRYAFYVNVSDEQFSIKSPPVTILVMPKTEPGVVGPDYTFIFTIIIAVCIIAACLGVALYVSYRPR